MARFVSPHRNYSHGVREEKPQRLGPYGEQLPEQKGLSADFSPDLRTDEDVALAKSTFDFRGLPIWENGQTIDPTYRIAVFDSEVAALQNQWTQEEHDLVVETLRHNGPIGQMYIEVVPAPAEKPWNGYDELEDADRIVELALGIGADLDQVIAYESQNENREAVVEALGAAKAGTADETFIVSA